MTTEWPFLLSADCSIDVATFLAQCDGTQSAHERLATLRGRGVVPPDLPDDEFAAMVRSLVTSGFLTLGEDTLSADDGSRPSAE